MTIVTIFGSSLVASLILVLLQAWELRKQRKNIILRLLGRLDPLAERFIETLRFRLLQAIQTVRFVLLVWSKEFIKSTSLKIKERAIKEFEARNIAFMGKKEIKNNGSVSFYLRKIKEEKANGGKGKIEEELN